MSTILEQKCPNCGGAVEWSAGVQKLVCPFCDTEFELPPEPQEAPSAPVVGGEDNINWQSQGADWQPGETEGMGVYVCNSCGGEIVADASTGATTCPYCDNPVVMKGQFSGGLKPDLVIPFKYDKKAAKEALIKHISSKKMVPKIFKDRNHIEEIKGVYVPHWLFNGTAVAEASFNAERVRSWSDSNYKYTEKEYFNCFRSGNLDFKNVPVDGSSKMDDTLMESIEPFDASEGKPFNTAYLAGYLADKYDVDINASIPRANERVKNSIVSALEKSVREGMYSLVTPLDSNVNIANGTYTYALYPVWILNTTWDGKKYVFAMNGQTGKFVGDLPVDKKAFWKKVAALTAPLSVVAYLVLWALGNM